MEACRKEGDEGYLGKGVQVVQVNVGVVGCKEGTLPLSGPAG